VSAAMPSRLAKAAWLYSAGISRARSSRSARIRLVVMVARIRNAAGYSVHNLASHSTVIHANLAILSIHNLASNAQAPEEAG